MLLLRLDNMVAWISALKVNVRKTSSGEKRPPQASQVTRGTEVTISFARLNLKSGTVVTAPPAPFLPEPQTPSSPSCHRRSHPEPSPTSTCTWKDTSAGLCDSHRDFGSRESGRETPGFSATETGKQSLRKRCQVPVGHIFPSKHCQVSRGFSWRSCLGMCLLFLDQQAPYLKRYMHIWCGCYHGKCHAFFSVEKKDK